MRDFNWIDFAIQFKRASLVKNLVPKGSVVLDVGCGYYPKMLASIEGKIKKGVGLDKDPPKKPFSKKIRFVKKDVSRKLPFKDGAFNCILMLAVLEHLYYPVDILKECKRVLKRGGHLIITVPSVFSRPLLEFLASIKLISREEMSEHLHYLTKKQLEDMAIRAGLKIVESRYCNLFQNILLVCKG